MSGNVETPIETGQKVILSKQNIDDKHHNFIHLSSTYFSSLQLCQSQTEKEIEDARIQSKRFSTEARQNDGTGT